MDISPIKTVKLGDINLLGSEDLKVEQLFYIIHQTLKLWRDNGGLFNDLGEGVKPDAAQKKVIEDELTVLYKVLNNVAGSQEQIESAYNNLLSLYSK